MFNKLTVSILSTIFVSGIAFAQAERPAQVSINLEALGSGQAGYQGELRICDFSQYPKLKNKKIISYGNGAVYLFDRITSVVVNISGADGGDACMPGANGQDGGNAGKLFITTNNEQLLNEVIIENSAGRGGAGGPAAPGHYSENSSTYAYSSAFRGWYRYGASSGAGNNYSMNGTTATPPGNPGRDGKAGRIDINVSNTFCDQLYQDYRTSLNLLIQD